MYLPCRISSTVDLSYLSKVAPPGKKTVKHSILLEIEHLMRYIVTSITDFLQRSDVLIHILRQFLDISRDKPPTPSEST